MGQGGCVRAVHSIVTWPHKWVVFLGLLEIQYAKEGELNRQHEVARQVYSGRTTYSLIHLELKSQTAAASDAVRVDRAEPSAALKISNSIYLDDNWNCARKRCHRVGPGLFLVESAPGTYSREQYCSLYTANVDCGHRTRRCTVVCTLPSE
jgi:hypothetical protein